MATLSLGAATVTEPSIFLWPNPGPLDCGIIASHDRQAGGSGKFSLHHLKKLIVYARSKGKHAYPWMSYSVWSHIAKNKLSLSEELSWLYFETFDVISEVSTKERLKLLDMTLKCSSSEELDHLRKRVSVDTMKFILFLYIQNAPRLSLKAPLLSGDEWPSPESEKKLKSSEYAHVSFLKMHLSDVLQLLADSEGEQVLSVEAMKALDFLIIGSQDKQRLTPLVEMAVLKTEAHHSGYSEVSQVFSLPHLEQWLRAHLYLDPFGPLALKAGSRDKKCPCYRSETVGRIVSNTLSAPAGSKCVLLHKINQQTLSKNEEGLSGSSVHIQNCRGSNIYLLAPLKAVQVEKCSHCLLVLGAVETAVTINNCDSITVVTACRRLHVSSSSLCTFHLLTMTRPAIFPSTFHTTLAPYNTHYPLLKSHLEQCGLVTTINYWNNPFCIGTVEDETEIWQVMPPENFRPLAVPFAMEGDTQDNPCPLPKEYQAELSRRKERIREWYEVVKETGLSQEQAQQLQTNVQAKFQEWLEATGHRKEIVDLEIVKHRKQ